MHFDPILSRIQGVFQPYFCQVWGSFRGHFYWKNICFKNTYTVFLLLFIVSSQFFLPIIVEWQICSESPSLWRILARKGGVREIQNWFTCGSASGWGLFPKLGSLWYTGLNQRSTSNGSHVQKQLAFLFLCGRQWVKENWEESVKSSKEHKTV